MMYYNALSIFMFKINPFKVVIICFIYGYQIFEILKKYDFFSSNNKIFYTYEPKVSKENSTLYGLFECLKFLTHKKLCNLYV
jgi:hypothetical protein